MVVLLPVMASRKCQHRSDKAQKRLAAKFCGAQGVVPFLEVAVRSLAGLEDRPVDITDIDVLGLGMGRAGAVQRLLFDCKTTQSSALLIAHFGSQG